VARSSRVPPPAKSLPARPDSRAIRRLVDRPAVEVGPVSPSGRLASGDCRGRQPDLEEEPRVCARQEQVESGPRPRNAALDSGIPRPGWSPISWGVVRSSEPLRPECSCPRDAAPTSSPTRGQLSRYLGPPSASLIAPTRRCSGWRGDARGARRLAGMWRRSRRGDRRQPGGAGNWHLGRGGRIRCAPRHPVGLCEARLPGYDPDHS
jgi:hypothetical protein